MSEATLKPPEVQRVTATSIRIDASAHCQLACPLCPTADGRTREGLGRGHLKLADFERLLDRNPEIAQVELSNYGEMFLNPQLPAILAAAHERQVTVSGANGANLNHASEEALEAVVKYRLRSLTCSIDGATQETYGRYRVNGDLERVLTHVDKIREHRRAYGSAFPMLDWQFVVFGHNEHELPTIKALAAERGMGFRPRLSWDEDFSPIQNRELVRLESGVGAASRSEFREQRGIGYGRKLCLQLWRQPALNWDGRLFGCCVNYWQDFGVNAFDVGLDAAVNHPTIEHTRRMLMGQAEPQPDTPCLRCDHYRELQESGAWLTEDEVAAPEASNRVVAVVPPDAAGTRFAQVSVVAGGGPAPARQTNGRLFRYGVDTAVYFAPRNAGPHTVYVKTLSASGWSQPLRWRMTVPARPLCQQWNLEPAADMVVPAPAGGDPVGQAEPTWIR